jgi:hypothetical protein
LRQSVEKAKGHSKKTVRNDGNKGAEETRMRSLAMELSKVFESILRANPMLREQKVSSQKGVESAAYPVAFFIFSET